MKIDGFIEIEVEEGVYPPSDDTFLLLELLYVDKGETVLEIGTGSGIVSIHCAKKGASVTAVDKSQSALDTAKKNAEGNGTDIRFKESDLFSNIEGIYDVIIFNPPYLPVHEDLEQDDRWDGGEVGDEVILQFLKDVDKYLREDGRVYLVFSDMARLERIESLIDEKFVIIDEREKRYRFESLFTYEIKLK